MSVIDGLLAATAIQHNLTLVARNTRDVAATGVSLFNPWPEGYGDSIPIAMIFIFSPGGGTESTPVGIQSVLGMT